MAKVDELMALCDRLEAARVERESRRDRLLTASLSRLNTPYPKTFQADARFALDTLPALTTRPDQIKQLRQAIFDAATYGRLVPQDGAEKPASALLPQSLGSIGRRKGCRNSISTQGMPDLPRGWATRPLGALVEQGRSISYGVLVPGDHVPDGIPFVRAQDLSVDNPLPTPGKSIHPTVEAPFARTRLRGGEILMCVVGSIGKLGRAPASWAGANIARAVVRIAPIPELVPEYLLTVLRASTTQSYFADTTRTLAQPTLNVGLLEQVPIPIPPLAEQHRIVAKVTELMTLCDRLEAALVARNEARRALLEATLRDALAPALDPAEDRAA